MGIPSTAFRAGDLYIEYEFEEVLFRYEKEKSRYFRKFYTDSHEYEVPHDSELLNEAIISGVLTTAERYFIGGAPAPITNPTANSFSLMATKFQRTRPYWLSVTHLKSYIHSGDIEVGISGRLDVVKTAGSIKEHLEKVVSDINFQSCLTVICNDGTPITIYKTSKDFDFGLRIELKKHELTVISESSFYRGRSSL